MSNVDHPKHYNHGAIEVAVAMDILNGAGQWLGHALKYACRAPHKGKFVEDIEKAVWCAERVLKRRDVGWSEKVSATQCEAIVDALISGVTKVDYKQRAVVVDLIEALVMYDPETDYNIACLENAVLEAKKLIAQTVAVSIDTSKAQLSALSQSEPKPKEREKTLQHQVSEFQTMIGRQRPAKPEVPSDEILHLRLILITEEFCELLDACGIDTKKNIRSKLWYYITNDSKADKVDMVALADAMADLDFVVEGTRQELGIDGAPIAMAVYRANMAKLGGPKDPSTGKHLKPEGWKPPDIGGELTKQGW